MYFRLRQKDKRTNLVKNILQLVLRQSRAFDILDSTQLLRHPVAILLAHRLHLLLGQFLAHSRVISQIRLGPDDQARNTGAVVVDFREPFFPHVLKRGRRGHREADEENVGLRVGQRTQAIVILLSGGIEKTQSIGLVADPIASLGLAAIRWEEGFFFGTLT